MVDADVVADVSGISFVDGRRAAMLVYNMMLVAVPLLLGQPVVKCSQAMGPLRTPRNRRLARLVLPHLEAICPRGTVTEAHLRAFGLDNLRPAADLGFAMAVPDGVRARVRATLARRGGPGPYLVVAPSQIVDRYCTAAGIDYRGMLVELIEATVECGDHRVVIVAHAVETRGGATHMNDLPLCRAIRDAIGRHDEVVLFDEDLLPTELRAIIGLGDILVTSRLHAMISALVEGTPMLVIGWSHKYAEILEPFGLGDVALSYDELAAGASVTERVSSVADRADEMRDRMAAHLPRARARAEINFEALRAAWDPISERR